MANIRLKDLALTKAALATNDELLGDGDAGTFSITVPNFVAAVAALIKASPSTYKLATLDDAGKIPTDQDPSQALSYKGSHDVSANSPALADGVGTAGDTYMVSVAGSRDYGSGSITLAVGDALVYSGSVWQKVPAVANLLNGQSTASGARTVLEVNSSDEAASSIAQRMVGPALSFDGVNDLIEVADADILTFGRAFSIVNFIKPDGTLSADSGIISKDDGTNREWSFIIDDNGASDQIRVILYTDASNYTTFTALTGGDLRLGKQQILAFTWDGSAGVIYRNGKALTTASAITGAGFSTISNTIAPLRIGKSGASNFFKGHWSRSILINYALSAAQVAEIQNADIGFSDEWGGLTGGIYTSDFSVGTDGWSTARSTLTGNVDSIGGLNDTLRSVVDTSNNNHPIFKLGNITAGKRYRISVDVYIPSTNSVLDGVKVNLDNSTSNGTIINSSPALDTWVTLTGEGVAVSGNTYIYPTDGGSVTVNDAGGDDAIYLRNIKITALGSIADFRAEDFNSSSGKLLDRSSNNLAGVNNGATLTGARRHISAATINLTNIPTSAAGLGAGEVWSNSGVLTIVT